MGLAQSNVNVYVCLPSLFAFQNHSGVLKLELITFEILGAERLRLMRFNNRLIIDCFASAVNIVIDCFVNIVRLGILL